MLLFLLYFGQGLPYGFQVKLLPLLLRKQSFSLSRVGFSRLLSLPWIFKFTVAPFVDNFWSLDLWILFGSMAMAILCFTSAVVGFGSIFFLLVCVFLMNLTSAVQDVAVDTFAISLLKPSDLGEFVLYFRPLSYIALICHIREHILLLSITLAYLPGFACFTLWIQRVKFVVCNLSGFQLISFCFVLSHMYCLYGWQKLACVAWRFC